MPVRLLELLAHDQHSCLVPAGINGMQVSSAAGEEMNRYYV